MTENQPLHGWWDTAVVERVMHQAQTTSPKQLLSYLLQHYPEDEQNSGKVDEWPVQ